MYFTHSLIGAVAQKFLIDKVETKFTEKEKKVLWFVGITASVFPDFDLVYSILNNLANHRQFLTHGLFIYLVISLTIYLFSFTKDKKEFGKKFYKTLAFGFLIGVLIHFLMDYIVGGVVFLAPFSYKVFEPPVTLARYMGSGLLGYLSSRYMFLELYNLVVFFLALKDNKYRFGKIVALSYFIVAIMAFIFISIAFFG